MLIFSRCDLLFYEFNNLTSIRYKIGFLFFPANCKSGPVVKNKDAVLKTNDAVRNFNDVILKINDQKTNAQGVTKNWSTRN